MRTVGYVGKHSVACSGFGPQQSSGVQSLGGVSLIGSVPSGTTSHSLSFLGGVAPSA